MPDPTYTVISIGTLGANPLWNEREPVRTGHATTTLIVTQSHTILTDPGLPATALQARLGERVNLAPDDITDVFLTSFGPDTIRGIELFPDANWWIHGPEREGVGIPLLQSIARAVDDNSTDLQQALEHDAAILERCQPVPDNLDTETKRKTGKV